MATIQYVTTIEFGAGVVQQLPQVLEAVGIRRPLLVTDAGLVRAGVLARIEGLLQAAISPVIFGDTPANTTEAAVMQAASLFREAQCDGVVGIGGGSPLDLAKGVALMGTHAGRLADYAGVANMPRIGPQAAPVITIPTTSGTGSEVGRGALLCLADGRKLVFASPHLMPRRALCDPELTHGLPASLTAGTGMDALTHCIETFLSPRVNPTADAIALDGAARAWRWIETAVREPGHARAREEMMIASIHGGMAFQKGLGAVHALSHPLGGLTDPLLHHGTLNAVILPAVLRFNAGHVGDKYARLATVLGLSPGTDLAVAVTDLNRRLGLPRDLRAMGVGAAVTDAIVAGALADHCVPTNPRPLDERSLRSLLQEALG